MATNPVDVLKVRLQLQTQVSSQASPVPSGGSAPAATAALAKGAAASGAGKTPPQQLTLLQMLRHIVHKEGPASLMAGWQASVMREMSYSAIRLGLYDEVKDMIAGTA
jgi:hypothetical protein